MSQTAMQYIHEGKKEFFASKIKSYSFPKAEYREALTHILCILGVEAPFTNAVWQLSSSFADEHEIERILDVFKHKDLPFFWWELPIPIGLEHSASEQEPTLGELLVKKGLQAGGLLKGVCTQLNSIHSKVQIPTGVTIRQVQSAADLKLFCQLIFSIHGVEPHIIEQIYLISENSMQAEEEVNYLAYHEGKPIGGITLATGKKTAGLWNFAILETHRKQGVGSALIQVALTEAQQRGYQDVMAILMPSEMGQLWHQFHFQEICYYPIYIGLGKQEQTNEEKSKRVRKKTLL